MWYKHYKSISIYYNGMYVYLYFYTNNAINKQFMVFLRSNITNGFNKC